MVMSHKYITMCWAQLEIVDARCESRHTLRILSRVVGWLHLGLTEFGTLRMEWSSTRITLKGENWHRQDNILSIL